MSRRRISPNMKGAMLDGRNPAGGKGRKAGCSSLRRALTVIAHQGCLEEAGAEGQFETWRGDRRDEEIGSSSTPARRRFPPLCREQ